MNLKHLLFLFTLLAGPAAADQTVPPVTYAGLCEASAAVYLGDRGGRRYFAVASDEVNILRSYDLAAGGVGKTHDIRPFTGFDKSDIEGGARIGDRVWWISSHSVTASGKDKQERRILIRTGLTWGSKGPELQPLGLSLDLRDAIAGALAAPASKLNIEALAAGADGALLIGLRAPLAGDLAQVLPLRNPDRVLEGEPAEFGPVLRIDLGTYGIRSLEQLKDGRFLVVAGPVSDGGAAFRLYLWDGVSGVPQALAAPPLDGLRPEAAFQREDGAVMLLSDDGDPCAAQGLADDQPKGAAKRQFRWIRVELP